MGGLGILMAWEDTGNLLGYEGWGLTFGEEGIGQVGGVSVGVIRVAEYLLPLDIQREGDGALARWREAAGEMEALL